MKISERPRRAGVVIAMNNATTDGQPETERRPAEDQTPQPLVRLRRHPIQEYGGNAA